VSFLQTTRLFRDTTPTTQTSFAISANGIFTQAQVDALTTCPTYDLGAAVLNDSPAIVTRGGRFMFFGTAADNTTHDYRIYGAWRIAGDKDSDVTYLVACLAYGQFTLSSAVGGDDQGAILTSHRIADTITTSGTASGTSPAGIFGTVLATFGGSAPQVWSPADNTPGMLFMQEFGNPAKIIVDLKAASGSVGAIMARDT